MHHSHFMESIMMAQTLTISIQDYLKNIYELTENGETASTNALS